MERKESKFVHGFPEYQPKAKELEGLLSEPIDAFPSISPGFYIAGMGEHEFILHMRGLLPTSIPTLDKKMTRNFVCGPFGDDLQLIKNQSIPTCSGDISAIAYWPREKFGFYDTETGRSARVVSDYRLRQIDTISDGRALVDHSDQDHMFYDTYCSAEHFAKQHQKGYWGLSVEEKTKADTVRKKKNNIQSEIWKLLGSLELETISVDPIKLKKFWAIGGDRLDKNSFIVLAYDTKGQTMEDRYDIELRGVLPTGVTELDLMARQLLLRGGKYCYLLKDSVERISNQKIKGFLYHPAYSLTEEKGEEDGQLPVDTYRTWQPLAVALGYCVVDHDDKSHPLYATLVEAENLAKRYEMGFWGVGPEKKTGK